jgi:hypothetical protein
MEGLVLMACSAVGLLIGLPVITVLRLCGVAL